jgi:hypothetical protein
LPVPRLSSSPPPAAVTISVTRKANRPCKNCQGTHLPLGSQGVVFTQQCLFTGGVADHSSCITRAECKMAWP